MGSHPASVQGLVPLVLELWQGTTLLLDACSLVLAARPAQQLERELAQDSMAQAAATALSEPPFQSLPGATEFVQDMCLFLSYLSPVAQRAPAVAAALGLHLLSFAVRHGQVAAAQALHACMDSAAGREAMGAAAGCGPVLSLKYREQMARLARRSGVQGMSEAVTGWSVAAPAALMPSLGAAASSSGKDTDGPPTTAAASPRSLLLACLRGFPDVREEGEYAEYFAAAGRSWRLWSLVYMGLMPCVGAISFALRNKAESALPNPCATISFLYGIAFVAEYRSTAGSRWGSCLAARHHPWRPRAHEILCVVVPFLIALHLNTVHLFCSPAAIANWLRFSERLFVAPLDLVVAMITAAGRQTRTPWALGSAPFRTW
jgi:hypothetical protein